MTYIFTCQPIIYPETNAQKKMSLTLLFESNFKFDAYKLYEQLTFRHPPFN